MVWSKECIGKSKASLKARLTGPKWMDELPMVLLGIRTAWREDAECSPADLVYGTALHLPGEFFNAPRTYDHHSGFLRELQCTLLYLLLHSTMALDQHTFLVTLGTPVLSTFAMVLIVTPYKVLMSVPSQCWSGMRNIWSLRVDPT